MLLVKFKYDIKGIIIGLIITGLIIILL